MNLKVLSLIFLCLFTASMICNVATITVSAPQECNGQSYSRVISNDYFLKNAIELELDPTGGDPIPGGGWPR